MSLIDQVAERAGVSRHTVSRVLKGESKEARASTARRADLIRSVATEFGYRPNAAATAMRAGRFFNVALVLGTRPSTSTLPRGMLTQLHETLEQAGYHIALACLPDDLPTRTDYLPAFLRQWMCDGLLINYNAGFPERMIELIRQLNLPSVWLNVKRPLDAVYPDDLHAGAAATAALLAEGRRRILYLDHSYESSLRAGARHYSKPDRLKGYTRAMRHAGLLPEPILDCGGASGFAAEVARQVLRGTTPAAVVAYSEDEMYLAGPALAERGLRLGRDIRTATFASEAAPVVCEFPGLLWNVPEGEVARRAVGMLLEKMAHPGRPIDSVAVPFAVRPPEDRHISTDLCCSFSSHSHDGRLTMSKTG